MGVGQMYTTLIVEAATLYGHLNVFKHEWGHSILDYFDAAGTSPEADRFQSRRESDLRELPDGAVLHLGRRDRHESNCELHLQQRFRIHPRLLLGHHSARVEPDELSRHHPVAWATDGPVSKAVIDLTVPLCSDATAPTTLAEASAAAKFRRMEQFRCGGRTDS